MPTVRAGYGKGCITPPLGTEMAGFAGEGRTATGVHDDLYARVLLLQCGSDNYCLIQTDLLDIDEGVADAVKKNLEEFGLLEEHIFVGAIHTHSGPKGTNKGSDAFTRNMKDLIGVYDEEFCSSCIAAIRSAVAQAFASLAACSFRCSFIRTENIATNRNDKDLPGDPVLLVLEGRRTDGKKILLYSIACHPTIMNWNNRLVSADLPGGVAARLEGGEYEQVIFLNGSCGDISTRFTKRAAAFEEVDRLAAELTDWIHRGLANAGDFSPEPVAVASLTAQLAVKELDPVDAAEEKLAGYIRELTLAKESGASGIRLYESRCEGAQVNLTLSKGFGGLSEIPIEIRFLCLGPLRFVFVPGELFSALSNPLRVQFGNELVFCSYFGGYQGYIADVTSYKAETYETLSSPYEMHQGEKLMEKIREFITVWR